ncbi:MAG TPA: PTS system mannose/fructose/sorbose family transporter subunit IID [Chloroflexota bacterium]|jgi:PTS system mannose-specific IID component
MSSQLLAPPTNGVTHVEEAPPAQPEIVELDAATVRDAMWRHIITLQWSWNYERMQALGYCWSMLPIINKIYKNREERIAAIKRHLAFYNTNPQVGSPPIFGATVALEAQRQPELVDSLKVGLMGPMAAIGDTTQAILFRPIVAVLAASLALAGSVAGPLIMVLSGLFWTFLQIPLFRAGYQRSLGLAKDIAEGGVVARVTEFCTIAGMVVIGGFIPSIMAKVTTPLQFARDETVNGETHTVQVALQSTLDQMLPYAIPLLFVGLAYYLMRRFRLSPVWVLVILTAIGFTLSAIGFL